MPNASSDVSRGDAATAEGTELEIWSLMTAARPGAPSAARTVPSPFPPTASSAANRGIDASRGIRLLALITTAQSQYQMEDVVSGDFVYVFTSEDEYNYKL